MSANPNNLWTVLEYLAFERNSDLRHEFINGEIYAMAGAKANHNIIVGNCSGRCKRISFRHTLG